MTDAPDTQPEAQPNIPVPQIRVMGQYVKDLSFENPGAPDSMRAGNAQPDINVGVDVKARPLDDETFEVVLVLNAHAKRGEETMFITELTYAGLFQLRGLDQTARDPFLLIECPRLIFPFARRVLSDATRDGGFPPLMLEPIDFAGLYRQQLAKAASDAGGETGGNPPAGTA